MKSDADACRSRLRPVGLTWREVQGEIIVLDLRSDTYLSINAAGAELWPRLIDGATAADLTAVLREHHGLDADRAEHDVAAFLAMLSDKGLLE